MRTVRVFTVMVLLCLQCVSNPTTAFAQKETLSHFLGSEFKAGALLVMEGDRYIDPEVKELRDIAAGSGSVVEKLTVIAEKCDYEVTTFEGTYLLHKRYSAEYELPCVSEKELLRFNEDLSRVVRSLYFPDGQAIDPTTSIHSLLLSLPESDWALAGSEGLPVRALAPRSRQIIVGLLARNYCGGLLRSSDIVGKWGSGMDDCYLHLTTNNSGGGGTLMTTLAMDGETEQTRFIVPRSRVGTASTLTDQNASFYGSTIGDVLERVNARSGNEQLFTADDVLLEKPVEVVGLESASPLRVIECIGKLYDLRLAVASKVVKLAQRRIQLKPGVDPGERMAMALPYPLGKLLAAEAASKQYPDLVGYPGLVGYPVPVGSMPRKRNPIKSTLAVLYSLYPQGQGQERIPLRTMDRLYRVAYVQYLFAEVLGEIQNNKMARFGECVGEMNTLYLRYRRSFGVSNSNRPFPEKVPPLTFEILANRKGDLYPVAGYGTSTDIPRD